MPRERRPLGVLVFESRVLGLVAVVGWRREVAGLVPRIRIQAVLAGALRRNEDAAWPSMTRAARTRRRRPRRRKRLGVGKKYDIMEIEAERRYGYEWGGGYGSKLLIYGSRVGY